MAVNLFSLDAAAPDDVAARLEQMRLARLLGQKAAPQSFGQAVMQQALSDKPVYSHAQGLARMLQAGLGGLYDRIEQKQLADALKQEQARDATSFLGLSGAAPTTNVPAKVCSGASLMRERAGAADALAAKPIRCRGPAPLPYAACP